MTRNEKKTAIENMAERFMNISDLEGKINGNHGHVCIRRGQGSRKSRGASQMGTERGGCNDRLTEHENNRQEPFLIDWRCSR